MSAWHATHPAPYDDACPDCAGYPTDGEDGEAHPHLRLLVMASLIVAVLLVFLAKAVR